MKPLLIIPPAPERWAPVATLLEQGPPPGMEDLRQRVIAGVPGARDALAVTLSGGQCLASAAISKSGAVGVLRYCFTRPDHRGRGLARHLMQTLLSWFEMTGGGHLYLSTTSELDEGLYRKFGFVPLHRAIWAPHDRMTMVRCTAGRDDVPFETRVDHIDVRAVTRPLWPWMVAMLQYVDGPDPRVPTAESAVTAELLSMDLLDHAERGKARILGAFQGKSLVGLATLATERPGERTHALVIPHTGAPSALHDAIERLAQELGYARVDFPMRSLVGRAPSREPDGMHPSPAS